MSMILITHKLNRLKRTLEFSFLPLTEDEMVGWHHPLAGHEFKQTPGGGDGQGSLVCYHPLGHKESDMTE